MLVLDTFEAALRDVTVTVLRPRLERAQLLREEDMIRVGRLGGASAVSRLEIEASLKRFSAHSNRKRHVCVTSRTPYDMP